MLKIDQYLRVHSPSNASSIFAVGDIADTGTFKTGRAAGFQGLIAAKNVVRTKNGGRLIQYRPGMVANYLDLTIGLVSQIHTDSRWLS